MNVAILCTMINSFGRPGFYNSQEIGLGRALARKGHQVLILKCLKKAPNVRDETLQLEPGLSIRYLPVSGLGAHGYLKTSILRQVARERQLQAILCFLDTQIFAPHIFRFCRREGICFVPYMGAAHSLFGGLHGAVMNAWFALGSLRYIRKSHVIAKTATAEKELHSRGIRDVTVAPVGLDQAALKQDFLNVDRRELRQKFGFSLEDVILCDVCRLEEEKRPLELLDIFDRVKDRKPFKLLLVGEGPLEAEVEKKIQTLGLTEQVKRIRRVPYQDIWQIYAISDYFVNLSPGEIFGMAIMEAVYYRCSVAATVAPGPTQILGGLQGHCVCQDDRQIEDWLCGAYPSQEELAASAETLCQRFSWDHCADTFLSIVQQQRN